MTNEKNYICVHCGYPVKSLYKQYSHSVLKLYNCDNCGNVVDKYIEYDKIIILIDLILFNKEAYQHVLFNAKYKNHIKLAVLELMVISYDECVYGRKSVKLQESGRFYEVELYFLILAIILGKLLFFLILVTFLNICNKFIIKKPVVNNDFVKIWEAIVSSSFGYFLLLTILIWDDFQREIHIIFITTYIFLSQNQALSVTTRVPQPLLGAICIFATAADHLFTNFLKWKFEI